MSDHKEHLEIEMEMKDQQVKEIEQDITEITEEKNEFKDKYIEMLNQAEENDREIDDITQQAEVLNQDITEKAAKIRDLDTKYQNLHSKCKEMADSLIFTRDELTRSRVELKSKIDLENLRNKLEEENRIKELALEEERRLKEQELAEKASIENEVLKKPEITTQMVIDHPAFRKVCEATKKLHITKQELESEIEQLKQKLDGREIFNEINDRANHSNKIKHFQKIKDENNFLKKELVSLFNENRRLKQSKGEDGEKSKNFCSNIKMMEMQCRKMEMKVESRNKELRDTTKNADKMCDYILSRPLVPNTVKDQLNSSTKIERAIKAIAFMSEQLLSKSKEIQELNRGKNNLEFSLQIANQEKQFFKQNLEQLAKNSHNTETNNSDTDIDQEDAGLS